MVKFNEEEHSYKNNKGEQYISVTTLIHKYASHFDSDYWSLYKALEKIDPSFKKNKKHYLISKDKDYLLKILPYGITVDKLYEAQSEILAEWKVKNKNSLIKGSAFHLLKETQTLASNNVMYDNNKYQTQDYKLIFNEKSLEELKDINYYDCLEDGFYSELLLFNHYYKVAGTSDIVIIHTDEKGVRWVLIDDYKTNKKIDLNNRYDKMKAPLSHLDCCNGNHYNLQTSMYAYLLECMGFKVAHTKITWIDKDLNEIPYDFSYKRKEVIDILEDYKNN